MNGCVFTEAYRPTHIPNVCCHLCRLFRTVHLCKTFTDPVRKEFQDAWQKLAAATDWNQLAQHSQQQSDDQISSFLRQTDLCNAAQTCYHSQDCNVREAFPPEGVMDFVVDQAAAGLDAAAKQLMQGAFARGKSASSA